MTNQQILDNAPEGATHYSQGMHYLALNSSKRWMRCDINGFANAQWFKADDYPLAYCNKNFRSLVDIAKIAELEAIIRGRDELINNAVSSRIAELEKSSNEYGNSPLDLQNAASLASLYKLERCARDIRRLATEFGMRLEK